MNAQRKTVTVTEKVHKELKNVKAMLILNGYDISSINGVIDYLINFWRNNGGEKNGVKKVS